MKKSLIIFCVVLVLSIAFLASANAAVSPRADDVVFKETAIIGDPKLAEGIVVTVGANMNYHLHWNMTHVIGGETETDFRFSKGYEYPEYEWTPTGVLPNLDYNFSVSGGSIEYYDGPGSHTDYIRVVEDVMTRAPANEDYSETVYLKDYMDYLPVNAVIDLDKVFSDTETEVQLAKVMYDYFKIPVKDYTADIEVHVDSEGKLLSFGVISADIFGQTCSVVDGDKTYFTLGWRESNINGETVDYSHVPGGYGIYCTEVGLTSRPNSEYREVDVEKTVISTVYPLEENQEVSMLSKSADGKNLLMFTNEDGKNYMTVISLDTFETLQRVPVFESFDDPADTHYVYSVKAMEKGVAVFSGSEKFDVFKHTENGYEYAFSGDITDMRECFDQEYWYGDSVIDFDGERLACIVDLGEWIGCDFAVGLYDAEGLQYVGRFDCSLTTTTESDYRKMCRFNDTGVALAVFLNKA